MADELEDVLYYLTRSDDESAERHDKGESGAELESNAK